MILYHITTDLNHSGEFFPRHSKYEDERDYSKLGKQLDGRICFSESLHGCLGSMSTINKDVEDDAEPVTLKVFELHVTNDILMNIITPKELVDSGLVWDAEIHREYWFTEPIKLGEGSSFEFTLSELSYETVKFGTGLLDPETEKVTEIVVLVDGEKVIV